MRSSKLHRSEFESQSVREKQMWTDQKCKVWNAQEESERIRVQSTMFPNVRANDRLLQFGARDPDKRTSTSFAAENVDKGLDPSPGQSTEMN
jgi:hypothetical protein